MQILNRRNILDLIGRNSSLYHSCIVTCYSFDFSFFENRLMRALRLANVRNIMIQADAACLDEAQEFSSGQEFQPKNYSFLPIHVRGAFHPKIMLLVGKQQGLLIIGSGNITSSGLNTNDEVWAAFQMKDWENENAALLLSAWQYLNRFIDREHPIVGQQWLWINQYAPWLNELNASAGFLNLLSLGADIQLLTNGPGASIYAQLWANLPSLSLKTVTIISPYYDKDGAFLKQLVDDLQPQQLSCYLDLQSEMLPFDMSEEAMQGIKFYDWSVSVVDYNQYANRLHAKMMHFTYEDGSEYLLLGSANATMAAMGSITTDAYNEEACLLLKRQSGGNWLTELGISIPALQSNIPAQKPDVVHTLKTEDTFKYSIRLRTAILSNTKLTIESYKELEADLYVQTISAQGTFIENIAASIIGRCIYVTLSQPQGIYKVWLCSKTGERLSRSIVVQTLDMLRNCNPDPEREKVRIALEEEYPDGEGITRVLEYITEDWVDEEDYHPQQKHAHGKAGIKKETEQADKNYAVLSADAFNSPDTIAWYRQMRLLSSNNVLIAEFLQKIASGLVINGQEAIDTKESIEQQLLNNSDQAGKGNAIEGDVETKKRKPYIKNERHVLEGYFKKIDKSFLEHLRPFFERSSISNLDPKPITLNALHRMQIPLCLLANFFNRYESPVENEISAFHETSNRYMPEGNLWEGFGGIKGCVVNTLGKFLLLASGGFTHYKYDSVNQKMMQCRLDLFTNASRVIFSLNWQLKSEEPYFLTLLLNLHFFVLPPDHLNAFIEDTFIPAWKNWMEELEEITNKPAMELSQPDTEKIAKDSMLQFKKEELNNHKSNFNFYCNTFLPAYLNWLSKYEDKQEQQLIMKEIKRLKSGAIIFHRKIGFNILSSASCDQVTQLSLERPGYPQQGQAFMLNNILYGKTCITYE